MLDRIRILLRGIIRKVYLYGFFYNAFSGLFRVRHDIVMLESHLGVDFIGSPHAMATHLLEKCEYGNFTLVIVGSQKTKKEFKIRFPKNGINVIPKSGLTYCFYLATAGWLINDSTFPLYFSRRPGQKYLNTWHGTPLKTLGRDIADETFAIANTQRNFLHATALLSPNPHTENVLLDAYMLRGIWQGDIIRCGYPRNDILFKSRQIRLPDEHINIAFMPTWRGNFTTLISQASYEPLEDLEKLLEYLDSNISANVTLWARLHPLVSGRVNFERYRSIKPFPGDVEPYAHLACCHALITDYSSVMFDYATTLRPILLYTPDAETYRTERNMYMSLDELPFLQLDSKESLLEAISRISPSPIKPSLAYLDFTEKFCAWDNGGNTERLCSAFLGRQRTADIHRHEASNKTKVLFYAGALLNNGIIRSFKTLLPMLDRERYDITVLADTGHETQKAESYFRSLDKGIKYIPLNLSVYISPIDVIKAVLLFVFQKHWSPDSKTLRTIWRREYKRLFGQTRFDAFVNFNGYSWRAAFLSLGTDAKKTIYVHNEMTREIAAHRIADARLLQLSYEVADTVAGVRENVETEYCRRVYDYTGKAIHVPNPLFLDPTEQASAPLEEAFAEGESSVEFDRIKKALAVKKFTFINVARFSPEKGQLRLIEAFEQVWAHENATQLIMIGGHGSLLNEIRLRQKASPARDSIFVVVGSSNPYPIFKSANILVLSSTYEGLPLVLFESMSLGIPIISTDIPGPHELLSQGYGLLVENSTDGLIEGMKAALRGEIPSRQYDFGAHNAFALSQFDQCIARSLAH